MRSLLAALGASARHARVLVPFPAWSLALAALVFAALAGIAASDALTAASRDILRGDQLNLAIMSAKLADPELFPRDHTFGQASLFAYYTPSFLRLTGWLATLAGDAAHGWALLLAPLLFVYLAGMFLLVSVPAKNWLVAAALAILSARVHLASPLEVWGLADLEYVLPRSLALAIVPWIGFLALVELDRRGWDRGAWWPVAVGFLIGLITNLHPGTGMHVAALVFPLLLVHLARSPRGLVRLAAAGIALLAGAAPMLATYLGGTGGISGGVEGSWDQFTQVVMLRLRGYIYPYANLALDVDALRRTVRLFLVAQGGVLGLAGIGLLARRRWPRLAGMGGRLLHAAWALSLVPLLAVVIAKGDAQSLLWLWVAFGFAVPLAGRPTLVDWTILALAALTLANLFWVTPFLQHLWRDQEIAALSSVAIEHARVSRFVYLPLYLAAARLAGVLVVRLAGGGLPRRLARTVLPFAVAIVCAWPLGQLQARLVQRRPQPIAPTALALYEWARRETPADALFFFPDLAFRYYARRSITHAWKDLSAAIYTRQRLLAEWARFQEYEAASYSEAQLVQVLRRDAIDYVVRRIDQPPLPLAEAFRNQQYVVYRVSAPPR